MKTVNNFNVDITDVYVMTYDIATYFSMIYNRKVYVMGSPIEHAHVFEHSIVIHISIASLTTQQIVQGT